MVATDTVFTYVHPRYCYYIKYISQIPGIHLMYTAESGLAQITSQILGLHQMCTLDIMFT